MTPNKPTSRWKIIAKLIKRAGEVILREGPGPFFRAIVRKILLWTGLRYPSLTIKTALQTSRSIVPTSLMQSKKYDVVIFPVIDWEFRFQRPQQIASHLAKLGHRVFYVRTRFEEDGNTTIRKVADNLYEVGLPGPEDFSIYGNAMEASLQADFLEGLMLLRKQFNIIEAVALVDLPFWQPLAFQCREQFGWKVVYDCMDLHSGFSLNTAEMLEFEEALSSGSDLVLASSKPIFADQYRLNTHCILVPNACDYDHFAAHPAFIPPELSTIQQPIIGYYGAIAEWFDTELVAEIARAKPEWSFVLIGNTLGADCAVFKSLNNVHLLGEIPYKHLPAYLHHFNVCFIPFLRTPLTNATNPVKLFEFMAAGKSIVSRDLDELQGYSEYIHLVASRDQWIPAIEDALRESNEQQSQNKDFARKNTWDQRVARIEEAVQQTFPLVSIIIVTYNNLDYTKLCLQSIYEKTIYPNYEVILIDNASSDETPEFLSEFEKNHPNVKLVLNSKNTGFAAANNQGAVLAHGEYLVFLNNDTITPPYWLSNLMRHLDKDPQIGMIGPVTNWSGNESKLETNYQNLDEMEDFAQKYTTTNSGKIFEIRMLAFFCILMRKKVFEEVGPLDEIFGIGMFEDDDYAMRIKQRGYKIFCAEDSFVHHWGRASFSKLEEERYNRLFEENRRKFEEKWQTTWQPHQWRKTNQ